MALEGNLLWFLAMKLASAELHAVMEKLLSEPELIQISAVPSLRRLDVSIAF